MNNTRTLADNQRQHRSQYDARETAAILDVLENNRVCAAVLSAGKDRGRWRAFALHDEAMALGVIEGYMDQPNGPTKHRLTVRDDRGEQQ